VGLCQGGKDGGVFGRQGRRQTRIAGRASADVVYGLVQVRQVLGRDAHDGAGFVGVGPAKQDVHQSV
jgi:hypothetical protein